MKFDDVQIGHRGISSGGNEFTVMGVDDEDRTVMTENGEWLFFDECDFPEYEF